MIASTCLVSLLGLATAAPLVSRQTTSNYPPTSSSKGFNLIVNVTDPSADFSPSIQNNFVTSIHVGAGLALVGVSAERGRLFYQNGTTAEWDNGQATTITDGGTPATPAGLKLRKDEGSPDVSTANLDFGYGTPGVQLSSGEGYSVLLPETYAACNESLSYYQGKYFVIIKRIETTSCGEGDVKPDVPDGCVPVRLVPQCAELPDLPEGSYASHEFALDSECYDDVSAIAWSQYGP